MSTFLKQQVFILIGGAPTTGKSTLARRLARQLSLPYISTDQLREIVKPYGHKEQFPYLYDTAGLSAEAFLAQYTAQEIADMEFAQGQDVWPAIKGLMSCSSNWKDGGIIEGVNILPHLVAEQGYENKDKVKAIFVVDPDEERTRHVVYTRGLYAAAHTYSDTVKEKEVEWAMAFSKQIKHEAEKYNFPCISIGKKDQDLDAVMFALGFNL